MMATRQQSFGTTSDLILQCAIDSTDLISALRIAEEVHLNGATWIEVGTPLIKAVGMTAVAQMKASFPDTPVVADLKTLDFGELEVTLAAQAGAEVVMISALASNETIRSAARAAKANGLELVASLMGVKSYLKRSTDLSELGVDRVLLHFSSETAYSSQREVVFSKVCRTTSLPVGIGGSINAENAVKYARMGCKHFVVGRAITDAESPAVAAKAIVAAIERGATFNKS